MTQYRRLSASMPSACSSLRLRLLIRCNRPADPLMGAVRLASGRSGSRGRPENVGVYPPGFIAVGEWVRPSFQPRGVSCQMSR